MSADDKSDVEQGLASAKAVIAAATISTDAPDRSVDEAGDVLSRVELIDDGEEPSPPHHQVAVDASSVSEEKLLPIDRDAARIGPEIMHDDDGPYHPDFGQKVAEPKDIDPLRLDNKQRVLIHDNDSDDGPVHPATYEHTINDEKGMHGPNELRPVEDDVYRQKAENINAPTPDNPPSPGARQDNNISTRINPIENRVFEMMNMGDVEDSGQADEIGLNQSNASTANILGGESSVPGITEAYLVDDDIIVATPANPQIPWWKQRRSKLLIAFVVLLVSVLAISLGITLSSDRTVTQFVTATTSPPTTSAVPSIHPTDAPSSSQAPSSVPSFCSDKITTNTRQVELLRTDPTSPIVAVEGKNLVVAWKQFTGTFQIQGSFYTAFYSLSDDGGWEMAGYFIEANVWWTKHDDSVGYDVALSGPTAIIGLPAMNKVYTYRQNSAGLWEKVTSPEPEDQVSHCGGFGISVDICDDTIVVSDSSWCSGVRSWATPSASATYLFVQNGRQWKEVGRILSGNDDVIVDDDIAEAIEDVKVCGANYLAYTADDQEGREVHIYQRNETTRRSALFQSLTSSNYGVGFGQALTMDEDILVVGSANNTHIFSLASGDDVWEEALKLEQSYNSYEMSGRTLIVTNESGVYSLNIADCTPEMPSKAQPTSDDAGKCYPVSIATSFWYLYPAEEEGCIPYFDSTWEVSIMTDEYLESDSTVVKTMAPRNDQECGHTDSTTCLYPGRYKLKFNTDWLWHCYNLTLDFPNIEPSVPEIKFHDCSHCFVSDGNVAFFDVPYDPATLRMGPPTSPPQTYHPTSRANLPTTSPVRVTPFPTEPPGNSIHPTVTQWPTPVTAFPILPPTTPYPTLSLCESYTTKKTCTKAAVGCVWDEASYPPCSPG